MNGKIANFELDVSYKQIVICEASENAPFSFWTETHVSQGFVWRAEGAGFATLEDGMHEIAIYCASAAPALSDALVAIRVPFQVPPSGEVEVASIADAALFRLPPGDYELLYQYAHSDGVSRISLGFTPGKEKRFEVLRLPGPLPSSLDLTADPA